MTIELLRSAGMRATKPRIRVISLLQRTAAPLSVADIVRRLGKPHIDQVTVYRTLESFIAAGIVAPVELSKGRTYFEMTDREHHHHVVCRSCGRTEDVAGCAIEALSENIARHSKEFAMITSHSLEFFGECRECDTSAS